MQTVIYQIPVSPIYNHTKGEAAGEKINAVLDGAYHAANRAITLWLQHCYPQTSRELAQLLDACKTVKETEQQIAAYYRQQIAAENKAAIATLLAQKQQYLGDWQQQVISCAAFASIQATVASEFKGFPPVLLQALMQQVALDFLHSIQNKQADGSFTASIPFYRHEMHLPLCYDGKRVKWEKQPDGKRFTLHWLADIQLETLFGAQDVRLPIVLNELYFARTSENVRQRKPHRRLTPTLKKAGTKWSIHIPVLEAVQPIPAEKEDPLCITFGYLHPMYYAWGLNHAKPLPIDNAAYIQTLLHNFEKRRGQLQQNSKLTAGQKEKLLAQLADSEARYMETLSKKAVKAIIQLCKKGQKHHLRIEQWPVNNTMQKPFWLRTKNLPDLYQRFLTGIAQWQFSAFYNLLEKTAATYNIQVRYVTPQWEQLKLYTTQLKIKRSKKSKDSICFKKFNYKDPFLVAIHFQAAQKEPKHGHLCFANAGPEQYNDTNGGFKSYKPAEEATGRLHHYSIHIDANMAMYLANSYNKRNGDG